jgi:hypothetical protein
MVHLDRRPMLRSVPGVCRISRELGSPADSPGPLTTAAAKNASVCAATRSAGANVWMNDAPCSAEVASGSAGGASCRQPLMAISVVAANVNQRRTRDSLPAAAMPDDGQCVFDGCNVGRPLAAAPSRRGRRPFHVVLCRSDQ